MGLVTSSVKKASLFAMDGPSGLAKWKFQFNPSELSLTLERPWSDGTNTHNASRAGLTWGEPKTDSLEFDTLLDESEYLVDEDAGGVAALTAISTASALASLAGGNALVQAMLPKNDKSILEPLDKLAKLAEPYEATAATGTAKKILQPVLRFKWGEFKFVGVITKLDTKILLWDDKGKPRRAELKIEMSGRYEGKDGNVWKVSDPSKLFDAEKATKTGKEKTTETPDTEVELS
jgi:hypothetical protein